MNLNIKKIAIIAIIVLAITSCDKDKKTYLIEDININVYKNNFNNIFKSIYYAFCLILILPILITSTIVMYILLRDIIDINKKNINQVQTKSNIIYLISKEYIYNISFPLLVKTKDNKINVLMFSMALIVPSPELVSSKITIIIVLPSLLKAL